MLTIWKYKIGLSGIVEMPHGAKVLTVQTQRDESYLWALVDTTMPAEKRCFISMGTGQDAAPVAGGVYVGTYQLGDPAEVFHVFEVTKRPGGASGG